MFKDTFLVFIQTILNFIAINQIISWVPNYWVPDGILGLLVAIIIWGITLILSYAMAVRFKNEK